MVKQEMARVNIIILGISEQNGQEWEKLIQVSIISTTVGKNLRRNGVAIIVNKRVRNAVLECNLKNDRMISVCFQGKPFNITMIQVYAPTTNAEEAEVEWFYEDLQDLLELTPPTPTKKRCSFHNRDWDTKVEGKEIPGITGKVGLGVQNEAGQR